MIDRLVRRTLNGIVVFLVTGLATAALVLGYVGMLNLLGGHFQTGSAYLGSSPIFGCAMFLLIRYRADLTYC